MRKQDIHILIIDDEKSQRDILRDILQDAGYRISLAEDGRIAVEKLRKISFDMVLTDLKMPGYDGFEVLEKVKSFDETIPVIIMTAFGTIPSAVNAIKNGAYDYLTKPFEKEELIITIRRAEEKRRLAVENRVLKKQLNLNKFSGLVGKSKQMQEIYRLIEKVKDFDATILISGESGTGKELAARACHFNGKRKDQPFIAINCAAIPDTLIESELFGYEKGAFSGADRSYAGRFEQAQNGTIFLDEIGAMKQDMQTRLLRVLQERKIQRLGSTKSVDLNVRVIAASNENLMKKVENGAFRPDLFHRIAVIPIEMPPLREHKEDIAILVNYFMEKFALQYDKNIKSIESSALKKLTQYDFPGNVRELENIIEKAVIFCETGQLREQDIQVGESSITLSEIADGGSLPDFEKQMIITALNKNNGSIKKSAAELGISYKTLQYRIKKFKIDKNSFKN